MLRGEIGDIADDDAITSQVRADLSYLVETGRPGAASAAADRRNPPTQRQIRPT